MDIFIALHSVYIRTDELCGFQRDLTCISQLSHLTLKEYTSF